MALCSNSSWVILVTHDKTWVKIICLRTVLTWVPAWDRTWVTIICLSTELASKFQLKMDVDFFLFQNSKILTISLELELSQLSTWADKCPFYYGIWSWFVWWSLSWVINGWYLFRSVVYGRLFWFLFKQHSSSVIRTHISTGSDVIPINNPD